MPEMQQDWFILERSEAIISLLLLSRPDLSFPRVHRHEDVLQLLVRLKNGKTVHNNLFSIDVIGTMSDSLDIVAKHAERLLHETTFLPTCVVVVNVKDNSSLYSWIAKPLVEQGIAKLSHPQEIVLQSLDDTVLDKIVTTVSNWYSHSETLSVESHTKTSAQTDTASASLSAEGLLGNSNKSNMTQPVSNLFEVNQRTETSQMAPANTSIVGTTKDLMTIQSKWTLACMIANTISGAVAAMAALAVGWSALSYISHLRHNSVSSATRHINSTTIALQLKRNLLRNANVTLQRADNYTAKGEWQTRLNDRLQETQLIELKVRRLPLSIFLKLQTTGNRLIELFYSKGRNDGKVIVRENGSQRADYGPPDLLRPYGRQSITAFDLDSLVEKLARSVRMTYSTMRMLNALSCLRC